MQKSLQNAIELRQKNQNMLDLTLSQYDNITKPKFTYLFKDEPNSYDNSIKKINSFLELVKGNTCFNLLEIEGKILDFCNQKNILASINFRPNQIDNKILTTIIFANIRLKSNYLSLKISLNPFNPEHYIEKICDELLSILPYGTKIVKLNIYNRRPLGKQVTLKLKKKKMSPA